MSDSMTTHTKGCDVGVANLSQPCCTSCFHLEWIRDISTFLSLHFPSGLPNPLLTSHTKQSPLISPFFCTHAFLNPLKSAQGKLKNVTLGDDKEGVDNLADKPGCHSLLESLLLNYTCIKKYLADVKYFSLTHIFIWPLAESTEHTKYAAQLRENMLITGILHMHALEQADMVF